MSSNLRLIGIGGKDSCIRIYPVQKFENFKPITLTGHSDSMVNIFFESVNYDLYTLSK